MTKVYVLIRADEDADDRRVLAYDDTVIGVYATSASAEAARTALLHRGELSLYIEEHDLTP